MFVKQIDLNEAMRLTAKGREVKVLVPNGQDGDWNGMYPTTIDRMLAGCLFFRTDPAMVKQESEAAVQDMVSQAPPADTTAADPEPAYRRVGTGGKRKTVDRGKVLALHRAGRSNKWIAEDMGLHESTVCRVLKEMKEEGQDEKDQVIPGTTRGGAGERVG